MVRNMLLLTTPYLKIKHRAILSLLLLTIRKDRDMTKYLFILIFLFIVLLCTTYSRLFLSPEDEATGERSHANHCEGVCDHDDTNPDIYGYDRSYGDWEHYGLSEVDFKAIPKMEIEEKKR